MFENPFGIQGRWHCLISHDDDMMVHVFGAIKDFQKLRLLLANDDDDDAWSCGFKRAAMLLLLTADAVLAAALFD